MGKWKGRRRKGMLDKKEVRYRMKGRKKVERKGREGEGGECWMTKKK